jgi:hypothetical protein
MVFSVDDVPEVPAKLSTATLEDLESISLDLPQAETPVVAPEPVAENQASTEQEAASVVDVLADESTPTAETPPVGDTENTSSDGSFDL